MTNAHAVGCDIWRGGECSCRNRDPAIFGGPDIEEEEAQLLAEIERLHAELQALLANKVRISIPTDSMEQEINAHVRRAIKKRDEDITQLRGVIDRAAKAWLSLRLQARIALLKAVVRELEPGVAWDGDVGDAMQAAVAEIERLRAANIRLQAALAADPVDQSAEIEAPYPDDRLPPHIKRALGDG